MPPEIGIDVPDWVRDLVGDEYVDIEVEEVQKYALRAWYRSEGERLVRQSRQASEVYTLPPARSLAEQLLEVDPDPVWSVQGLHEQGNSTVLVAEAKAGKSTVALNLVRSLLTGGAFLGQFDVTADAEARILFLNFELSDAMFKRWVMRLDLSDDATKRLLAYHLRGRVFPLDHPHTREQVVEAIADVGGVEWVIVDPLQRAFAGDSNSNDEVARFLEALDVLKAEANVPNLLLIDHTGHAEKGRARGASVKAGWPDATWSLTRLNGYRKFSAFGRDVDVSSTPLRFDPDTLALSMDERPPERQAPPLSPTDRVLRALAGIDEMKVKSGDLRRAIEGIDNAKRSEAIATASDLGLVKVTKGSGPAKLVSLTDAGRERLGELGE